MSLADVLERGYLPKELPNPFVSASFAAVMTRPGVVLPPDFNHVPGNRPVIPTGKPTKYSHARGGLQRRSLCIPCPLHYFLLCQEIITNWADIQLHLPGTLLSATNPKFESSGRAIQGAKPQDARCELAMRTRINNRYILKTDISRFYHSIYTHSIPWALHTKAFAKANRGMQWIGNRIDYLVRMGQDAQTIGIPIGPDTSLVIAEILMQQCDAELLNEFSDLAGYRFIDDYELGFRNRTDAEKAYQCLEKILGEFELALNPKKTEIIELPCSLEAVWVNPLRSFSFRDSQNGQLSDLYHYFNLAYEYSRKFPDDPVLQYAIGRLWNLNLDPSNWEHFQCLLLNCVAPEPATLPYVLEAIIQRVNVGLAPLRDGIQHVLNSLIIDHSILTHSSEVAWALWACLALQITLAREATTQLSKCKDSVVALLALHCEDEGLTSDPIDHSIWLPYMNCDGLCEEHWLLAYEANIKGWLPSSGGGDHVANDQNYSYLKAENVSFYDPTKSVPSTPGGLTPVPILPTPPKISEGGY